MATVSGQRIQMLIPAKPRNRLRGGGPRIHRGRERWRSGTGPCSTGRTRWVVRIEIVR